MRERERERERERVCLFVWLVGLVSLGFVLFHSISSTVTHLMPNLFYITIKYMISKHILKITFLYKPDLVFFSAFVFVFVLFYFIFFTQLNGFI